MSTNDIRAAQPSTVLEDFRWQRKSRPSSLPSYHRRSLPCVREQPFAARCPAAVSRDIRAVPSSSKLKDLFWTRTSRLFTPQVIIFALGYSTRLGRSGTALGYSAGAALGYITRAQHSCRRRYVAVRCVVEGHGH